jgi:hypothetical protein
LAYPLADRLYSGAAEAAAAIVFTLSRLVV